jgi:hypothetical protein
MWLLWMAFRSTDATECAAADAILALIWPRLGMCLALPPPLLHGTAEEEAAAAAAAAAAWLVIFLVSVEGGDQAMGNPTLQLWVCVACR